MSMTIDKHQGRKTERNFSAWLCVSVVLVLICGLSILGLSLRNQRRRAVSVLDSLNQVTAGTTGDEAIALIIRAGGRRVGPCSPPTQGAGVGALASCNEAEEQYGVYFGVPDALNRLLYRHPILQYVLQCFGVHPWMAQASLIRREGKVTGFVYSVTALRKDGVYVASDVEVSSRLIREPGEPSLYRVGYDLKRNLIHRLHAWISPDLPLDERRRLATYKLDCLTTIRGCLDPGEISPGAWSEYVADSAR